MLKGRVKSTTGVNLRLKPNGDKVDVLGHNEEFTIVDEVMFYRVKSKNGQVGYVHGDYVEKIPASIEPGESTEVEYTPGYNPVVFQHDSFVGEAARVDQDFVQDLERLAEYASQCQLKIWVTSSLRSLDNQVKGAIVKPASKSCHHIGHAIDMNILYEAKLYNSKMLRKNNHSNLPGDILQFFEMIKLDMVLRWGGNFRTQDPVHIDNNFYNRQRIFYLAKLDSRVSQANA